MKLNRCNFLADFILPLALILAVSFAISLADLDRGLSHSFYQPSAGWIFGQDWLWAQLYRYGMIPGIAMATGGLLVLISGIFVRHLRRFWRPAAFLFLLILLGPGLLVNTLGKDMWGRPRPIDTVDFGGTSPYHQFYQPAGPGQGKSFPSGHASIGFYTLAPFFLLRRRHRKAAMVALTLGTGYGVLMSIGRIVQGGHYLTDVLWSGYLVYSCGMVLYYLLLHSDRSKD